MIACVHNFSLKPLWLAVALALAGTTGCSTLYDDDDDSYYVPNRPDDTLKIRYIRGRADRTDFLYYCAPAGMAGAMGNGAGVVDPGFQGVFDAGCAEGASEPKLLAVGADVLIGSAGNPYGTDYVRPASAVDFVSTTAGTLQAAKAGTAAFLFYTRPDLATAPDPATDPVSDYIRFEVRELARVAVTDRRSGGERTRLTFDPNSTLDLSALAQTADGRVPAGRLRYAWRSSDEAIVTVETTTANNAGRLSALASGAATVTVEVTTTGGTVLASAAIPVTVTAFSPFDWDDGDTTTGASGLPDWLSDLDAEARGSADASAAGGSTTDDSAGESDTGATE